MTAAFGVGSELAGYRLERLLGRGGMGDVYLAVDTDLGRNVAVKVLSADLARDDRFRERFLIESRLAASLEHPHVVPVYAAGDEDGVLYLVMRFVEGEDLGSLLHREGPLTAQRVVPILAQVADALDTAHARGLLHRDVKPANVLLDPAGRAYLADFGLARDLAAQERLTRPEEMLGTIAYAAPEQIDGRPLDATTDVYALACVACECLTGEPPFVRDSEAALLFAHLREPPPSLAQRNAALAPFDPVFAKALAKSGDERYPSCAQLVAALEQLLPGARTGAPQIRAQPLPVVAPLVGRARELDDLVALLRAGELVTLTGTPGSGRTRLALAAASRLRGELGDRVAVVSLSATARQPPLLRALARAAGVAEADAAPLDDTLRAALGELPFLLVLDDVDCHADGASQLLELRESFPTLVVASTSSTPLVLNGERAFAVSALADVDAVALFGERAGAARPGFELTAANESHVAAICQQLGNHPLAIELAAARVKLLPVDALRARLEEAKPDVLDDVVSWTVGLLAPACDELLARLAVFADGFSVDAAQAVCGALFDQVSALVDAGLVYSTGTAGGEPRFAVLPPIRAYGDARLAAAERSVLRRRHALYCETLVTEAHSQAEWLERLVADAENIRGALGWTLETSDTEATARIAGALGRFWRTRTTVGAGTHWTAFRWLLDDAYEALAEVQSSQAEQIGTQRSRLEDERGRLARTTRLLEEDRRARAREFEPAAVACPYKGLEAFDTEDADVFFGREELVAELLVRLAEGRFLALVGASGSGKSSLLRAGLVAAVARGALPGSADWKLVVLKPGAHALEELAIRLSLVRGVTPGSLVADLRRDPASLVLAVRQALLDEGPDARVLLVVDQFEEVFTLCDDENERRAFVDALLALAAAEDVAADVVVAMRADFYGHCAAYPGLAAAVQDQQALVGRMRETELRDAVERPAEVAGMTLEPGLTETILRDVGDEPGALPLLSHALRETWKRRSGATLTLGGYTETGGVSEAIARTAEAVLAELTPEQQRIARGLFLRLSDYDEGRGYTRRRATRAELVPDTADAGEVEKVLGILADARLVTVGEDSVEVVHEALIREWPTLRRWLEEDREGLVIQRRLGEAAAEWRALGRDPGALYRGARLQVASDWAERHGGEVNPLEREFLETSRSQQQDDLQAARRHNRRLRALSAGLAALLTAAAALGAFAVRQRQRADDKARLATSAALVRAADAALASNRLDQGLLLGAEAYRTEPSLEARNAVLAGMYAARRLVRFLHAGSPLRAVAVSPNGGRVAAGGPSGVTIWAGSTGRRLGALASGDVAQLSFLADGRLAARGADGHVSVSGLGETRAVRRLPGGGVLSMAASADGSLLALGTSGGSVTLWDVRARRRVGAPVRALGGPVAAVALTAGGALVAAGGPDGIAVWRRGGPPKHLAGSADAGTVQTLAFGRGGVLASATGRDRIALWNAPAGTRLRELTVTPGERVTGLAFAADGRTLAAGTSSGTTFQWRTGAARTPPASNSTDEAVVSVGYGGALLASADALGTVALWDAAGSPLFRHLPPGGVALNGGFSPSGQSFATVGVGNPLTLYDVRSGRRRAVAAAAETPSAGPPGAVDLAFASDGTVIVTVDIGGRVSVWDARQRVRVGAPIPGIRVGDALSAAVSSKGLLAVGTRSGDVVLVALGTRKRVGVLAGEAAVAHVAFSRDGERLAAASKDTIRIWNVDRRSPEAERAAHATSVAFSPDGKLLAAAGGDGVRIWKPGGSADALEGGRDAVSVAFSPDGRTLAAGRTGQAVLWDVDARRRLGPALAEQAGDLAVAFDPRGGTLATASKAGDLVLWDPVLWARGESLVSRACALAGRNLTRAEWDAFRPGGSYRRTCPQWPAG